MCGHLAFGASLCLLGSRNQGDSKRPEQAAGWRAVMGLLGLLPLQLLFRGHPVGSGARAVSLKMRWSDSRVLTLAGWCVCVYMGHIKPQFPETKLTYSLKCLLHILDIS